MSIKIALAGNPNSGKTTMFNVLTGSSQYVGNWPGVTVEKKEGKLRGHKDVTIVDLPGIYSLSPYTLEEVVARNFLVGERPDAIINIVDATNIERNLYLTTQLLELDIPVVVALNMIDVINKQGDVIDGKKLSAALGCDVVETSALKEKGCLEAAERAMLLAQKSQKPQACAGFSAPVEGALKAILSALGDKVAPERARWYAIKLFERDEKVMDQLKLDSASLDAIEAAIQCVEAELDDDCESIITNERYGRISGIVKDSVKKQRHGALTASDKIDRIVTNRFLALPIFAAVMVLVYYVSVSTLGAIVTDWTNDVLFGEFLRNGLENWLVAINTAPWLVSLALDGILGGVGAVLGFLPQMLILFFFLALLEDSGYMARIAFIMDRIFRKFGLSGKSFIPILIGTGCGVPGIMASRTIENDRDRKMTIITTTFIPCGAKLPIIALIAGALFADAWWVGPSAYFVGIAAIILSGILLKKTRPFAGNPAPFVMELPSYRVPGVKGVLIHMWDRGKAFVVKAGTIIFLASGLIWFTSSFSWSLEMVDAGESILASIGSVFAPLFAPLGWGDWKAAVASITGLVAKEGVVSTFGVLYGVGEVAEDGVEIWGSLQAAFTALSAYSFLVFNLLCAPCFAAVGAIRREMGSFKWTMIAVGYQTGFAYFAALSIYQIGLLFTGHGFTALSAVTIALIAGFLYLLFRPQPKLCKHIPKVQVTRNA
ncbi:MAG: ferrous iron transport protein B [Bacillota bacterium]